VLGIAEFQFLLYFVILSRAILLILAEVHKLFPQVFLLKGPRVSDDKEIVLCPCNCNIHSSVICHEPEALLLALYFIASHAIDHNDVLLSSLEGIDCVYLNV
jgi:hypothetical protein